MTGQGRQAAALTAIAGTLDPGTLTRADVAARDSAPPLPGLSPKARKREEQREETVWTTETERLADVALGLAAASSDAGADARALARSADRCPDRFSALAGARLRLAGMLDARPDDLVAVVALGLVSLAAIEPVAAGRNDPTGSRRRRPPA